MLAEAVQTVLRAAGVPDGYELLKDSLARQAAGPRELLAEFIRSLPLPEPQRARLLALTPAGYVGLAPRQLAAALAQT